MTYADLLREHINSTPSYRANPNQETLFNASADIYQGTLAYSAQFMNTISQIITNTSLIALTAALITIIEKEVRQEPKRCVQTILQSKKTEISILINQIAASILTHELSENLKEIRNIKLGIDPQLEKNITIGLHQPGRLEASLESIKTQINFSEIIEYIIKSYPIAK